MKIIYGIAGEGMGHAIRSSVVIQHLIDSGHEIYIVSSGRAAKFLHKKFKKQAKILQISGLKLSYKENKIQKIKTFIENLSDSPKRAKSYRLVKKAFKKFKPSLVITDFEPMVSKRAIRKKVPIIAIDNIQLIDRCKIDKDIKNFSYKLAKSIVKNMTPKCNLYMITSFFEPKIKKKSKNTKIYKPILRPEIINATIKDQGHIVVYQTSDSAKNLINELKKSSATFIVYGAKRDLKTDHIEENLIFKPFSEFSFIQDMASASAVISGGSFTVMSECLFMGKPLLSVPVQGQFEQEMNAWYLEKYGYGKSTKHLSSKVINDFIKNIDFYKENVTDYKHDYKIFEDLDKFIKGIDDKDNKI